MHTISLTRTTAIDAPPEAVLAFVADPRNLPRWAPGFAPAIRPHGAEWLIEGDGRTTRVGVHVSRESRTVDFVLLDLAVAGGGAFSRVLSAGQGSEYVFSLVIPGRMDAAAIDRQTAIVDEELAAIRDLCETPKREDAQ